MKRCVIKEVLLFILIGILFFGCQCGREDSDKTTIALVVKTLNHPFFIDMENGGREAADKTGVNLIVQGPEREVDVEKQMQIIENLIQRRVDALCIAPCGSKEIVPAIVKANRAGIPVLIVDTRVDTAVLKKAGGQVETFIGSDNFEGGRIAGEYIAEKLEWRGKVAILEGIPGHETGDARRRGFHRAIDNHSDIEVVVSLTANWERDQGYNVFQSMLQAHPGIQALFACNDLMALGAIEAIAAVGRMGEIIVVGFDALKDAREAIRVGTMEGSVAQFPFEMGRLAVEYAHRLMNGESIPEYIPVKIELITKKVLESLSENGEE